MIKENKLNLDNIGLTLRQDILNGTISGSETLLINNFKDAVSKMICFTALEIIDGKNYNYNNYLEQLIQDHGIEFVNKEEGICNDKNNLRLCIESQVHELVNNYNFNKDLESSVNRNSQENKSNTPDFILADFMENSLHVLNEAILKRDKFYGFTPSFSKIVYIQMSHAGRVCGVWDHKPSLEERANEYTRYLGMKQDDPNRVKVGDTTGTWVEIQEINGEWRESVAIKYEGDN